MEMISYVIVKEDCSNGEGFGEIETLNVGDFSTWEAAEAYMIKHAFFYEEKAEIVWVWDSQKGEYIQEVEKVYGYRSNNNGRLETVACYWVEGYAH